MYRNRNESLRQVIKKWKKKIQMKYSLDFIQIVFLFLLAYGSLSHPWKFWECQDYSEQQLKSLWQVPSHPHTKVSPAVIGRFRKTSPWSLSMDGETDCSFSFVGPYCWQWSCCRNLTVQISPGEVQGCLSGMFVERPVSVKTTFKRQEKRFYNLKENRDSMYILDVHCLLNLLNIKSPNSCGSQRTSVKDIHQLKKARFFCTNSQFSTKTIISVWQESKNKMEGKMKQNNRR